MRRTDAIVDYVRVHSDSDSDSDTDEGYRKHTSKHAQAPCGRLRQRRPAAGRQDGHLIDPSQYSVSGFADLTRAVLSLEQELLAAVQAGNFRGHEAGYGRGTSIPAAQAATAADCMQSDAHETGMFYQNVCDDDRALGYHRRQSRPSQSLRNCKRTGRHRGAMCSQTGIVGHVVEPEPEPKPQVDSRGTWVHSPRTVQRPCGTFPQGLMGVPNEDIGAHSRRGKSRRSKRVHRHTMNAKSVEPESHGRPGAQRWEPWHPGTVVEAAVVPASISPAQSGTSPPRRARSAEPLRSTKGKTQKKARRCVTPEGKRENQIPAATSYSALRRRWAQVPSRIGPLVSADRRRWRLELLAEKYAQHGGSRRLSPRAARRSPRKKTYKHQKRSGRHQVATMPGRAYIDQVVHGEETNDKSIGVGPRMPENLRQQQVLNWPSSASSDASRDYCDVELESKRDLLDHINSASDAKPVVVGGRLSLLCSQSLTSDDGTKSETSISRLESDTTDDGDISLASSVETASYSSGTVSVSDDSIIGPEN